MRRHARLRHRARPALVAVGLAVGALGLAPARPAQAHHQGFDSVDGCEIRTEDETAHDVERRAAEAAWMELRGGDGCVRFRPDTASTIADIQWKDVYRTDVSWVGFHEYRPVQTDNILFNDFRIGPYDTCGRINIALHEVGHALGLAHSFEGQVMNQYSYYWAPICTLQDHDIADYEELWGSRHQPTPPAPPVTLCPDCSEK